MRDLRVRQHDLRFGLPERRCCRIDFLLRRRRLGQRLLTVVVRLRLDKIGFCVRELRLRLLKLRRKILAGNFRGVLLRITLRLCRRQRTLGLFAVDLVLTRPRYESAAGLA